MTSLSGSAWSMETEKEKVVVPESPSARVTLSMERSTWSSLVMVPRPRLSAKLTPAGGATGKDRSTVKVSLGSMLVSPLTLTVICWVAGLAPPKVRVPRARA